jgi:hypothetical protein
MEDGDITNMSEMTLPYPNAFSMHRLANLEFFPFGASLQQPAAEIYSLSIFPQDLYTISDVIAEYAQALGVLFDVNHDPPSYLHEIADEQGVPVYSCDAESLTLEMPYLHKFLSDFCHYNFRLFDLPRQIDNTTPIEEVRKVHAHNTPQAQLSELAFSSLFVESHDDCYVFIEARQLSLLKAIFRRTLHLYVYTILYEEIDKFIAIQPIPEGLADTLLPLDSAFTTLRDMVSLTKTTITMLYSEKEFDFKKPQECHITGYLAYDFVEKFWNIS